MNEPVERMLDRAILAAVGPAFVKDEGSDPSTSQSRRGRPRNAFQRQLGRDRNIRRSRYADAEQRVICVALPLKKFAEPAEHALM